MFSIAFSNTNNLHFDYFVHPTSFSPEPLTAGQRFLFPSPSRLPTFLLHHLHSDSYHFIIAISSPSLSSHIHLKHFVSTLNPISPIKRRARVCLYFHRAGVIYRALRGLVDRCNRRGIAVFTTCYATSLLCSSDSVTYTPLKWKRCLFVSAFLQDISATFRLILHWGHSVTWRSDD